MKYMVKIQIEELRSRSISRVPISFLIFNVHNHSRSVGSWSRRRICSRLGKNNDIIILRREIGLREPSPSPSIVIPDRSSSGNADATCLRQSSIPVP